MVAWTTGARIRLLMIVVSSIVSSSISYWPDRIGIAPCHRHLQCRCSALDFRRKQKRMEWNEETKWIWWQSYYTKLVSYSHRVHAISKSSFHCLRPKISVFVQHCCRWVHYSGICSQHTINGWFNPLPALIPMTSGLSVCLSVRRCVGCAVWDVDCFVRLRFINREKNVVSHATCAPDNLNRMLFIYAWKTSRGWNSDALVLSRGEKKKSIIEPGDRFLLVFNDAQMAFHCRDKIIYVRRVALCIQPFQHVVDIVLLCVRFDCYGKLDKSASFCFVWNRESVSIHKTHTPPMLDARQS